MGTTEIPTTSVLKPDGNNLSLKRVSTCQSTCCNISEGLTLHENYISNKLTLNLSGKRQKLN